MHQRAPKPIWGAQRIVTLAITLVAAFTLFCLAGWSQSDVCGKCGKERSYYEIRLKLGDFRLLSLPGFETDSRLSMFLHNSGVIANCNHSWEGAVGGRFGSVFQEHSCALGEGQRLWRAIQSTNVVIFLAE